MRLSRTFAAIAFAAATLGCVTAIANNTKPQPGQTACYQVDQGFVQCYFTPTDRGSYEITASGRAEKESGGSSGNMYIAFGQYPGNPSIPASQCEQTQVSWGDKESVGIEATCTAMLEPGTFYRFDVNFVVEHGTGYVMSNDVTISNATAK